MRASSGGTTLIGLALALALGTSVSAHRRDEYLQAARIAVEPDHVAIELDLTPGAAVADALLATIDGDQDGSLSTMEQAAYVGRVLGEMSLVLDGRPLPLQLASATFPDLGEARRGEAAVRLLIHSGVVVYVSTGGRADGSPRRNGRVPKKPASVMTASYRVRLINSVSAAV